MRRSDPEDETFRRFAAMAIPSMGRLAYLLCGDGHTADDLVQASLIKLHRAWRRIDPPVVVDAYVRKVLLRCWLDEQRKPWRRRESRDGVVPDVADDLADPALVDWASGDTEALRRALATLPAMQRAAVVLRFYSQLSISETADALRCNEGTVKSRTARGLAALRAALSGTSEDLTPMQRRSER
ncbi:sigma-70 family RNA polymerase sigma factor [Umezawaea sp. Da 62-37]|uniref:RNA polymerase sigma factor n=1 Tax=Umezawaea sp. Da 62-37 TaxID=3075927 RepID=UPI0028F73853|nr:sigma-70 family RNA polymerase sigma factor [Umezawaea sp. Da 62-37]WNV85851.1 sigma-70 family RNA polymerase sigma factor [Umezawaea sp. Da 62-37]